MDVKRQTRKELEKLASSKNHTRRGLFDVISSFVQYLLASAASKTPLLPQDTRRRFAKSAAKRNSFRDVRIIGTRAGKLESQKSAALKELAKLQTASRNGQPRIIEKGKSITAIASAILALDETAPLEADQLREKLSQILFPDIGRHKFQRGLRIAYIPNSPIPTIFANNVNVFKMCSAMKSIGVDVSMYAEASTDPSSIDVDGMFTDFGIEPVFPINFYDRPVNAKDQFIYDLVKSAIDDGATHIYTRSFIAAFFAVLAKIPVILELHKDFPNDRRKIYIDYMFRSSFFVKCVNITGNLDHKIRNKFPDIYNRTLVLPDAADPVRTNETMFDLKGNCNEGAKVGYVGHLYEGKGAEICVELARNMPHITFHLLGGTEEAVTDWQVKTENLSNIFFYGHRPHSQVNAFIQTIDICIAPFLREVWTNEKKHNIAEVFSPLKIFEYMANQKPIIASDLPVLREVLEHGKTAILCDPDNIEEFENAVDKLSAETTLRQKYGDAALEEFHAKYTWRKRAEKAVEIFSSHESRQILTKAAD